MNSFSTIIPVFTIIFLGWAAHLKGFLPSSFIAPANRIVYYMAIPAMIFRAVARTDFAADFHPLVTTITLSSMILIFGLSWCIGKLRNYQNGKLATFIQTGYHCNIGYMALAVIYYALGDEGLTKAGMLAGFLMILQNFLSVAVLSIYGGKKAPGKQRNITVRIFANPIILSVAAGMMISFFHLNLPLVIDRSLKILGDMALPTALLIIGASLSFSLIRHHILPILIIAGVMKLLLLPGTAFMIFHVANVAPATYLPAIILLASPTATVTYVMAKEMGGDTNFSVGAISTSTLLSALTLTLWLRLAA